MSIGLLVISPLIVFGITRVITQLNDDLYYILLLISNLLASSLFYLIREHFRYEVTIVQVLISCYLSYTLTSIWANLYSLMFLPMILLALPSGNYQFFLLVLLTPSSMVIAKYVTDLFFTKVHAPSREKAAKA